MKNKKDVIRRASEISGFKQVDLTDALEAFIQAISEFVVKGEDVLLFDFCKIIPELIPEREVYDLNSAEKRTIIIPAHRVPKARFADSFREAVKIGKLKK